VTAVTQTNLPVITHVTYVLLSIQKVCSCIYYTQSFSGMAGAALQLSYNE